MFWDRKTGAPLRRAIVWQCRRSTDICRTWQKQGLDGLVRAHTGLCIDPYFSASKIAWALRHDPLVRQRAREGRLVAGTIDAYLLWRLTGGRVLATDYTNASRTMLFDIHTRRWNPALCEALGIPMALLPQVASPSAPPIVTADVPPFLPGIKIGAAIGDQQASLFGHGCLLPGAAKVTYGTGCFFLVNCGPHSLARKDHPLIDTLCQGRGSEAAYALEGSVFAAGSIVTWLVEQLKIAPTPESTASIASGVSDANGVHFVPAFTGLGPPYWNPEIRAAFTGITWASTRAHLVRAALESIAYRLRDLVEVTEECMDSTLSVLRADGGVSRNQFLMQFQADILGKPVIQSFNSDTTALGAALLAGVRTNLWDMDLVRRSIPGGRLYQPRMPASERDGLYHSWRESLAQVLQDSS